MSDFDPPEEPDKPGPPPPTQEKKLGYLLVAFLIGFVCMVPACMIWYSKGKREMQAEAVKNGHAIYKVTDEFGRTQFEWLPTPATPDKK